MLTLVALAPPSLAGPDVMSGQVILTSGDWRLEYRDALFLLPEGGAMIIEDMCTLVHGAGEAWLSLGFMDGWVNVTVYAVTWNHSRKSRTIALRSPGFEAHLAGAILDGPVIQTSLPANENPEATIRALAQAAGSGPIELLQLPDKRLMATFSGRGLLKLLDRAIACGRDNRDVTPG